MTVKEKLQIIIITYNRDSFLERTLLFITDNSSPIREFDILIIDNNSTDNTKSIVDKFQKKYKNISYIKNPYNVGAPGNIVKAFEYNKKDYVWILADDDVFEWDNWGEVENAINRNEKAIVVSRMDLPDELKNDTAQILYQSAFNAAVIYSKELLNDTVFHNMYNNIDTMFPHLFPLINMINNSGGFYVLGKQIVKHGYYENKQSSDVSYTRGTEASSVCKKLRENTFPLGFIKAVMNLDNKKLRTCVILSLFKNLGKFFNKKDYIKVFSSVYQDSTFLFILYENLDDNGKKIVRPYIVKFFCKHITKNSKSIINKIVVKFLKKFL